jgi:hypothetical protein
MTVHHCPKCELRFDWRTELDDHCWHDHPEFRHEYPAGIVPPPPAVVPPPAATVSEQPETGEHPHRHTGDGFVRWLVPRQSAGQPRER